MTTQSILSLASLQEDTDMMGTIRLDGRTTHLLQQELARFGVEAVFVDINDLGQVERALRTPARLRLVEILSNPLLRVADLEGLAGLTRDYSCLLAVVAGPGRVRRSRWPGPRAGRSRPGPPGLRGRRPATRGR